LAYDPSPRSRIIGCGIYLRTDFWAKIESGGSYGHTCYVAKELAAVTERFEAFMAHSYRLLDDYGLLQVVLDPPSATASEDDVVTATAHYDRALKPAFEALQPAYLYERLCLGNPNGADLTAYAPADPASKRAIRAELDLSADVPVIGFTGTFGGWHGVDVLAAAIPRICDLTPHAHFLLIGDGNYKHLIDRQA